MNTSNKINVNYSSLVGLKAELMRKQAEVNDVKAKNGADQSTVKQLRTKSKKSQKKPLKLPSELIDTEDIQAHKKSQLMLEAKTRLYENLKKSSHNANPNYLVDFANKSDDSDAEHSDKAESVYSDVDDNDDWVEYTDCFGRTRKCLKEDLPRMKEKDKLLSEQVLRKSDNEKEDGEINEDKPQIVKEPEIEIMRRKWEEQMAKLANKSNIHYQDVLFDEARTHGVGYYSFAQDEEERAKQQENLMKLRRETEQKQREAEEARQLKMKIEQNRLKAARIRQRIRAGLPPELTEEEIAEINAKYNISSIPEKSKEEHVSETTEENESIEENKVEDDSLVAVENKIKAFGELLGKRNRFYEMSQEEWIEKRRKIRDEEFAPVYDNFQKGESFHLSSARIETKSENLIEKSGSKGNESDEECNIIGPLPPSPTDEDVSLNPGFAAEKDVPVHPSTILYSNNTLSNESTSQNAYSRSTDSNCKLNSDDILAGLKYLREKFEEKSKT